MYADLKVLREMREIHVKTPNIYIKFTGLINILA